MASEKKNRHRVNYIIQDVPEIDGNPETHDKPPSDNSYQKNNPSCEVFTQ